MASPTGVVAIELDCDIIVGSNSSSSIKFTFRQIPSLKGRNHFVPPVWC